MNGVPCSPVSVVIATRDRPGLLQRSVRSVLAQTIRVDEIIVVDDASRVRAESALQGCDDLRIHCLRHRTPRGGSAARNTGLRAAKNPYIAFLDDDDTWSPEKIEKQLAVFERGDPRVGAVFTWSCKLSSHDPEWCQVSKTPSLRLTFVDFLSKTFFGASVPLLRTDCVEKSGGFDENLLSVQDRDMWLRMAEHCSFEGVPEVLVQQYIHGNQISSDLSRKIAGREQFLEKHLRDLALHPPILAAHYWRLGLMYCIEGAYAKGHERLRQALMTDPSGRGPADDLLWSERAPAEHAQHLAQERFNRIGDVTLYY